MPSFEAEIFQWNISVEKRVNPDKATRFIRDFLIRSIYFPAFWRITDYSQSIAFTIFTWLPSQLWRQTEKLLLVVPILPKTSWESATEVSVLKHWQMEMVSDALAFFNWALKGMTRSNGWKRMPEIFKLEIRYKFLTVRVIKPWNSLSGYVMGSPWFDLFKSRTHVFLRNTP